MLADIRIDPNTGDIALVQNAAGLYDISLLTGADQVRQAIVIRLQTWYQEWVFDITIGIPFLDQFFIKNPSQPNIESLLTAQIMAVTGVTEVTALTVSINAQERRLNVSFTATTSYGKIADIMALDQQAS